MIRRPEVIPAVLLIIAFIVSALISRYFLDAEFLLDSTSLYMEIGIMALAMTFVIISGNIDLSVASALALVAAVVAVLHSHGVPMPILIPGALVFGAILGLFNGLLITTLRLPSLTVTLGTLALYRGIAMILLGDHSLGKFPQWFNSIDYVKAGIVPAPFILFLILAVLAALLLRRTVFGRCVYAIGTNEDAARFSGIRVNGVKLAVYVLSGLASATGALLMSSKLTVARYDLAAGNELDVITAVVLGGTDIFGGRGSIAGTVIALFLLGILRRGMGVANISAERQLFVTGTLLILAVILTNLTGRWRQSRRA